jgi:Ca-activated chloride channel family protein
MTATLLLDPTTTESLRGTSGYARLESPSGSLPLLGVTIDTTITTLIATTKMTQRFINPTEEHLEVTYIFPLPSRAGVTEFSALLGTRRIEGIVKERAAAREEYALAVAQGSRAALLEAERPDVFTVTIGNIAPGEEALIELTVTGPVVVEDGEATFRFPLVSAPRYITGEPLGEGEAGTGTNLDTDAVPDASRLNPPRLQAHQARATLLASVHVADPGLTNSSFTTSHPMAVTKKGKAFVLTLDEGSRMDSDLLVRFSLVRELTARAAVVVPRRKGEHGIWSVTVVAPPSPTAVPRDVVVLLDRSGSMGGWKMVAARRAAARLLDTLSATDWFWVAIFVNSMDIFSPGAPVGSPVGAARLTMLPATDRNRFAAVSWLSQVTARGGTEMRGPVEEAVTLLEGCESEREPVIILVTDGQIGAEGQLLSAIEPRLSRTRFCVVGIDRAPNTSLLERLATRSNGYATFVESEDRLDEALVNLHRRVGRPDLLGVRVSSESELIEGATTPGRTTDVFAGVPCIISGRFVTQGASIPELTLCGERADGTPYKEVLTPTKVTAKGISDLWARARIADLEDRYDAGSGDRSLLRSEIVDLSVSSKVLSRFSAFIAVDSQSQEVTSSGWVTQPVEEPSGWNTGFGAFSTMSGMGMPGAVVARGQMHTNSMLSLTHVGSSGVDGSSINGSMSGSVSAGALPVVSGTYPGVLHSAPGMLTGVPEDVGILKELLEEVLERLQRATSAKPARIIDLTRRLREMREAHPEVLIVTAVLTSYSAKAASLADTIAVVERALRTLSVDAGLIPGYCGSSSRAAAWEWLHSSEILATSRGRPKLT